MNNEELVRSILGHTGTIDNVTSAINCMTRLRLTVKDDSLIDEEGLKATDGVLGIVHDRKNYIEIVVGPGKSTGCAEICRALGIPGTMKETQTVSVDNDWQTNQQAMKAGQKDSPLKSSFKIFGEIFVPLIPGVVAAGLCAGVNALLQQLFPSWQTNTLLRIICPLLGLIHTSFLSFLSAWAGYRAAERFGGTPILGGMLGMITGLEGINDLSMAIGLWNPSSPLDSILRSGRGGILAAVFGVMILVRVEKYIRKRMPEALDIVFTPVLTLLACLIPYTLVIMPVCGMISGGICAIIQSLCMSSSLLIRILTGYISAALFLPLVAMGMHHGLVALYSVQLEQIGYITLYPALCMAGAGQAGAAAAIYFKAKKAGNTRMMRIISGALPAGILGIGEPLIYGVTLPLGRPFLTAGLGAGFGGAFVMGAEVAATTWGTSGLLGVFTMTGGPHGALMSILLYLIGLCISIIAAFLITFALVKVQDVTE